MNTSTTSEIRRYRRIAGAPWWFFMTGTIVGVFFILVYLFQLDLRVTGRAMMEDSVLAVMLAMFVPLAFIMLPATIRAPREKVPWYDYVFAGLDGAGGFFEGGGCVGVPVVEIFCEAIVFDEGSLEAVSLDFLEAVVEDRGLECCAFAICGSEDGAVGDDFCLDK